MDWEEFDEFDDMEESTRFEAQRVPPDRFTPRNEPPQAAAATAPAEAGGAVMENRTAPITLDSDTEDEDKKAHSRPSEKPTFVPEDDDPKLYVPNLRKKRSEAWDGYRLYRGVSGWAFDINCHTWQSYKGTTSNLLAHYRADKKRAQQAKETSQSTIPIREAFEATRKRVMPADDQERVTTDLVDAVCIDLRPLQYVQDPGFRMYSASLGPGYEPISAKALRSRIIERARSMIEDLTSFLTDFEYVSQTSDIWSSVVLKRYLGVTYHVVTEDFRLLKISAGVYEHREEDGPFDAQRVTEFYANMLERFGIDRHKLVGSTTDDGSNMRLASASFGAEVPVICICHCLNRGAWVAIYNNPRCRWVAALFDRVHRVVQWIRASGIRKTMLASLQQEMGLKRLSLVAPVETRWWSYFDMLDRFYANMAPLQQVLQGTDHVFNPDDWDNIALLIRLLLPVAEKIRWLEGERYVTLSQVLPQVRHMISSILQVACLYPPQQNFQEALVEELRHRSIRSTEVLSDVRPFRIATFLDPRYRSLRDFDAEEVKAIVGCVAEEFRRIAGVPDPAQQGDDYEPDNDDNEDTPSELRRYMAGRQLLPDRDPLEWWRTSAREFPVLARMARKYFSIQASSAPTERMFSVAGRIIPTSRNRLLVEPFDAQLVVHDNYDLLRQWTRPPKKARRMDPILRRELHDERAAAVAANRDLYEP